MKLVLVSWHYCILNPIPRSMDRKWCFFLGVAMKTSSPCTCIVDSQNHFASKVGPTGPRRGLARDAVLVLGYQHECARQEMRAQTREQEGERYREGS
jgi:hypothetical protein